MHLVLANTWQGSGVLDIALSSGGKKSIPTVANSSITSPYNLLCWFNSNTSLWFHPIYFCLVYYNCYSPTLNISTSILRSSGLGTAPFFPPVLRFFFHIQNMNCIILEHFAILITDHPNSKFFHPNHVKRSFSEVLIMNKIITVWYFC